MKGSRNIQPHGFIFFLLVKLLIPEKFLIIKAVITSFMFNNYYFKSKFLEK
ncbi:hypothetical protein lpa_02527 [Legionella pneumophila 2300/99 Alcoy]|nr:hypothetical protein lpa_02527 [Legionella pneumophila 2300/99 Alcoy]AGH53538.1 hypothetical protein LPE509_01447 [Legionella pneumophila subsp. pneumophila LPE509]